MTVQEMLLVILAEECSEVTHRATKALRFGINETNNLEQLFEEFIDVLAIWEMLGLGEDVLFNATNHVRNMIEEKKFRVIETLKRSFECGSLQENPEALL